MREVSLRKFIALLATVALLALAVAAPTAVAKGPVTNGSNCAGALVGSLPAGYVGGFVPISAPINDFARLFANCGDN